MKKHFVEHLLLFSHVLMTVPAKVSIGKTFVHNPNVVNCKAIRLVLGSWPHYTTDKL